MRTIIALAVAFSVCATGAQAQRGGSFTGRRGNTTSWDSNVNHGTATGSVTGPKGNTTSGTATATPQGGGVYGVTGNATGPRGRTTSRSGTVTVQ